MKRLLILLISITVWSGCTKNITEVQPESLTSAQKTLQTLQTIITASSQLTIYIMRYSDGASQSTITITGGKMTGLFSGEFIVDNRQGSFYYNLNNLVEYIAVPDLNHPGQYSALYLYFG